MSKQPATKGKPVAGKPKSTVPAIPASSTATAMKRKNVKSLQPAVVKKSRQAGKPVIDVEDPDDESGYGASKFKLPGVKWKSVSLLQNAQVASGSKELEGLVCIEVCDGSSISTVSSEPDMDTLINARKEKKPIEKTVKKIEKPKAAEPALPKQKPAPTPTPTPEETQEKRKHKAAKEKAREKAKAKRAKAKEKKKAAQTKPDAKTAVTKEPSELSEEEDINDDDDVDDVDHTVDDNDDDDDDDDDEISSTTSMTTKKLAPHMLTMDDYIGVTMADIEEEDGKDYMDVPYYQSPNAPIFHRHPEYLAWLPYDLHPLILLALIKQGFTSPRPIQSECLTPAIRDWKDVVGAAQTGSGKTLAFLLPVLNHIIQQREARDEFHIWEAKCRGETGARFHDPLSAMIITPTRELAMQIRDAVLVMGEFAFIKPVTLVGGLYIEKHVRQLQQEPPLVIGTPGRIWDIIRRSDVKLNLRYLRFFILDEADRMVANGHFSELDHIIEYVQSEHSDAGDTSELIQIDEQADLKAMERAFIKGVRSDKDYYIEDEDDNEDQDEDDDEDDESAFLMDMEDEDFEDFDDIGGEDEDEDGEDLPPDEDDQDLIGDDFDDEDDEGDEDDDQTFDLSSSHESTSLIKHSKPRRTQVFLFSATLTIQDNARAGSKDDYDPREGLAQNTPEKQYDEDGYEIQQEPTRKTGKAMLEELAKRLTLERPVVVDLSSNFLLPQGLRQYSIECDADEKDLYVYGLLYDLQERSLVFMNSIHMVRRTTDLLRQLGIEAFPLHAEMEQKQRLKIIDQFTNACHRIERLRQEEGSGAGSAPTTAKHPRRRRRGGGNGIVSSTKGAVLVCTDVAARGLDLPNIDRVIHYHLPRDAETYVHRSGRTARANKDGKSISLVSPQEDHQWKRIQYAIEIGIGSKLYTASSKIDRVTFNSKFLKDLRERIRFAQELVDHSRQENDAARNKKWAQELADACGYDIDDDEFDHPNKKLLENENSGRKKHQRVQTSVKLQKARDALTHLLSTKIFTRGGYYDM